MCVSCPGGACGLWGPRWALGPQLPSCSDPGAPLVPEAPLAPTPLPAQVRAWDSEARLGCGADSPNLHLSLDPR